MVIANKLNNPKSILTFNQGCKKNHTTQEYKTDTHIRASGLEDAWRRLKLTEDEEKVIVCEEDETDERIEQISLCLWGKLSTKHYFIKKIIIESRT